MASMLRILLQQQKIQHQLITTQENSTTLGDNDTNVLQKVTRLVYRLLSIEKIKLLQSIFVSLKRQQQRFIAKQQLLKNKSQTNTMLISYQQMLHKLNLKYLFDRLVLLAKKQQLQQTSKIAIQQHQQDTNNNKSNILCQLIIRNIPFSKLIRIITFFVDYVFVERRISPQQITLLQLIITKLSTYQQQQQNKQQLKKFIDKCRLLIKLAQQQNGQNINSNNKISESNQFNTAQLQFINQLKNKQELEEQNGKSSNSKISLFKQLQDKIQNINTLSQLYHHYVNNTNNPAMSLYNNLDKNIIPSLLSLTNKHSIQTIKQQSIQLVNVIRQNITKNNIKQIINLNQSITNTNNILQQINTYWLTVNFIEQTIRFFKHLYQSAIKNNNNNNKQHNSNSKLDNLQSILIEIGQLYDHILAQILTQILQQGLVNDLKNNYYLSQHKLIYHTIQLSHMAKYWLSSNNYNINNKPLISKQQQTQHFLSTKFLTFSQQITNQNKVINNLLLSINSKLSKILQFIYQQHQDNSNRLLSVQQYKQKLQTLFTNKAIFNTTQQQLMYRFQFMRWFVYDFEYNNKQTIIPQQSLQSQQNSIQQQTYNKLQQILCTKLNNQSSQQQQLLSTLLCNILHIQHPSYNTKSIKNLTSQQQQHKFLQQTFEYFHSPTYNSKYLTFNYIYGEMKDIYFYHNHHYSHTLFICYQLFIEEIVDKLNSLYDKVNNKINSNKVNKVDDNQQQHQQQANSHIKYLIYKQQQLLTLIFNKLRNQLGRYAKDHLLQSNSKQFYQYLNLFKLCYITFNHTILSIIQFDELILTFDLILNQIVIKENHPLIRQYIQIIMARIYFIIKDKSLLSSKEQTFCQCRNRMINMLDYDQQNIHNLNIGVPILMILGYQLISYVQEHPQHTLQPWKLNNNQQQINKKQQQQQQQQIQQVQQIQDEYGSKQIKPSHQLDIHYILVKYISCHVAYMRTICQYYMAKYIKLMKAQNNDILLQNLVNFWHSDKDSIKIMSNISIAIQGFKRQMNLFNNEVRNSNFYLCFQRVQQQPSLYAQYFLINDTVSILQRLSTQSILGDKYQLKLLFAQKIIILKQQSKQIKKQFIINSIGQTNIKKNQPNTKKVQKNKQTNKKNKPTKQDKRANNKQILKLKLQQKSKALLNKQQQLQNNQQAVQVKVKQNLLKSYIHYQKINQPKVIIIATLLQKVHNFGYLVRTLTSHNAMLTVPSSQPFTHPQCKQLLPKQEDIDVKVIEVKQKNLQSFIKMYQQRGYPLIALEQCSKSITLEHTVFPQKYMLLLGNERIGAPASLLNMADILVQIPQVGKVRSLNVHVSMVICFWEYLKQKNQKQQQKKQLQNKQ